MQRLLAGVDAGIGPLIVHRVIEPMNAAYRAAGIDLPETLSFDAVQDPALWSRALVLAPPSAARGPTAHGLQHPLQHARDAMASGWMQLRSARQRAGLDRGFVLSDHADWPGLVSAIAASGAERIIVTHGQEAVLVRWLQEQGLRAETMDTDYGDERANDAVGASATDSAQASP